MPKTVASYENNPLFIATKGLQLLFGQAISVAILFLILMAAGFTSNIPSALVQSSQPASSNQTNADTLTQDLQSVPTAAWAILAVIVLLIVLLAVFVKILLSGIADYTAAKLAKGEHVTLGEALGGVFSHFWGYAWVAILVAIKTFLWSLLLIVPGIVKSVQYSLAGVSYFDKKLSGNAAIKHSMSLTKGAWITTFAARVLLPILTFGALQYLTISGTSAVLYRQFSSAGETKPKAHIVSWLTLIIPFVLLAIFILLALAVLVLLSSSDIQF
ncbi:MAG: hypothetical protein ABJA64_02705 [Candidatus Saccharibacteria bacterium]